MSIGYPDSEINAVIDAPDSWSAKVAALVAHAVERSFGIGGISGAQIEKEFHESSVPGGRGVLQ